MNDDVRITGEVTELLQQLIRNRCVNEHTVESGQEKRSVDTLRSYLDGTPVDIETYEAAPGRESLVARIEGTDPTAPSLMLMGHLDVVPVNVDGWTRDPFAAELDDGIVWGRGAVDMLNLTASMAVALKQLSLSGFKPKGTLVYLAVADEEGGGMYGAEWLVKNHLDAVRTDYALTESACAGIPIDTPQGKRAWIIVGEKGSDILRLQIKGTPGHASMPFGADNALITAAHVVERIASLKLEPTISDVWKRFVDGMGFDPDLKMALLDPMRFDSTLPSLPFAMGRRAHACTRTTIAPTVMHGGTAPNVIPDQVDLDLNVRRLPGQTIEDVRVLIQETLGELAVRVEIKLLHEFGPSESPVDTPLWDVLSDATTKLAPGMSCVPAMTAGGTDAGYFRALGTAVYGAALYGERMNIESFMDMFHGNDERVDQESLLLSTRLWQEVARGLLF